MYKSRTDTTGELAPWEVAIDADLEAVRAIANPRSGVVGNLLCAVFPREWWLNLL